MEPGFDGWVLMRPLMNVRHRHREYFQPHPMFNTFALFATMILAGALVLVLGWLVTR